MLTTIQLGVSTVFGTGHAYHERVASIACLHDFSGPALLSCSKILTYQVLGSQLWTALPSEKSRSPATANKVSKSRHNSRTKLCIEISLVHIRDNIDFYLHCKFQSSPFSVRRKNGVTDRQNDRQRDYSMPRGSAHRGIMTHTQTNYCMPRGSAHRGINILYSSDVTLACVRLASCVILTCELCRHCLRVLLPYILTVKFVMYN